MNKALEAMARAYNLAKYTDPIVGPALVAINDDLIKPSGKDMRWMLAALRALAACEPSEGAAAAGALQICSEGRGEDGCISCSHGCKDHWRSFLPETMSAYRAMLAELVKECERDG